MFRTLIIAPTSLREAVMSQPLIAALARRGEVLAVAATPAVAPVYRAMGRTIAQVYELPFGPGRLDWGLRRSIGTSWRRRYDVAYVLAERWFDALLPWFAEVPRRVGWAGGPLRSRLLNAALPETADTPASGVARFLALAGDEEAQPQPPELALVPERVIAVCQSHGLQPGGYWAIAPGADDAPARCWPPLRYAELIRQLHDRSSLPAVLIGSGRDVALDSTSLPMRRRRRACRWRAC
jgi:heptosyltransferase-2